MKKVLAVADDITGADDIGLMYRKSGHPAVLYPFPFWQQAGFAEGEKLVVDTDSRFLPPEEAYNRVFRVVKKFSSQGVQQYINKQCSVFRGNIGPEFDAMLDALGLNFAAVVLGFPDNGRTTLGGIHYVHGVRLEESQFRNDPVNPMRESSLVKILAGQTRRPVTNVSWREYAAGRRLRSLIEQRRREGGYVIFDVRHNADLAMLAGLLKDEPVVCGSSAIAYYLGMEEGPGTLPPDGPAGGENARVLCLVGSLTPQTRQQVKCAQQKGVPVFTMHTQALFSPGGREAEEIRLAAAYEAAGAPAMAVIQTDPAPQAVVQTKQAAAAAGIAPQQAATAVSDALAAAAEKVAGPHSITHFIVCGGDTSASFCRRFDITGMRVGEEIEPGVPVCTALEGPLRFVLKSGSFGSPQFLEKARKKLLGAEKERQAP